MHSEPMIVTQDVQASSQFYQKLLLCESDHGGDEYEMLMFEGKLILQLHARDTHEHSGMWDPKIPLGNGMVLWFRTDDFDGAVARAREIKAKVVTEPHINPLAQHHEIWLRDPDGYLVVISDSFGDAPPSASD